MQFSLLGVFFLGEHVEWCLLCLDVWNRRHQTDRGRQQPVVGMRSERGQQHGCHQASVRRFGSPALNLLQHKIIACLSWRRPGMQTRHARRKAAPRMPISLLDPAGDELSCGCLRQPGHEGGRLGSPCRPGQAAMSMSAITQQGNEQHWWLTWFPLGPEPQTSHHIARVCVKQTLKLVST